jgi:ELWxxDGT repeat protein
MTTFTTWSLGLVAQALTGTVYVLYGSRPADPSVLDDAATAIPLENFPIPGAGAFLGRNEIFGESGTEDIDGDGQPDFLLLPGQDRWFRFTTLGDGYAGSQLLVAPGFETAHTALLRGDDARFDPTPPADRGSIELGRTLALGSEAGDRVVVKIDLSAYMDRREEPTAIQQALLTLDYQSPFAAQGPAAPTTLTDANGTLFFSASNPATGRELWKSDGTVLGTSLLKDINPGVFFAGPNLLGLNSNPQNLTNVNGTLFFAASDFSSAAPSGTELWKSDGTQAGTVLARDINAGANSSDPGNLVNVDGVLYFTANNGTNGVELWRSDPTVGAVLVRDINLFFGGTASSNPDNLTDVNGTLFFVADDGGTGAELWRSDAALGAARVETVNRPTSWDPHNLTNVNGRLYFTANDSASGIELWTSDGTAAGTTLVRDINTTAGAGSDPAILTNVNGVLYFTANDGVNAVELWRSDGTDADAGTVRLADVNASFAGLTNFGQLTVTANTLYFTAFESTTGIELWRYDVAANTLQRLTDIAPGPVSSNPSELTAIGSTLFFAADAGTRTPDLWKSDGSVQGTVKVSSDPRGVTELTAAGGSLFFTADEA